MKLSRRFPVGLTLIVLVWSCTNDKPQQPIDSATAVGTFNGAFGDSAKPDTVKPNASPVETGGTVTHGGKATAGTTDTGTVSPSGPGTTDTSASPGNFGGRGRAGTLDTASATTTGRIDARPARPTAGVYDTAVTPPPAPVGLRRTRAVIRKAGVHR